MERYIGDFPIHYEKKCIKLRAVRLSYKERSVYESNSSFCDLPILQKGRNRGALRQKL